MKTTLIIFLFLISSLIYIITFLKIKFSVELTMRNNVVNIAVEIYKKKFEKEIEISWERLLASPKEDIKTLKLFNKDVTEILELIEVEKLDIVLKLGTPFIFATTFLIVLISSVIPIIYQKTNNKNGKLSYKIEPEFNNFKIDGTVKIDFKITLLKLICFIMYAKKNNKKTRRRKNYEQSSYRGLNEYSYE